MVVYYWMEQPITTGLWNKAQSYKWLEKFKMVQDGKQYF